MLNLEENILEKYSKIIIWTLSGILLFLIVGIFTVYIATRSKNNTTEEVYIETTPIPLPSHQDNPVIPTSPPTPVPQIGDIIIDGIAVNNFKENSVRIEPNGNIVVAETTEYQILFNEPQQKFLLMLVGQNFETSQQAAEAELLQKLGIDELNICRLYIEEQIPASTNNEHSGKFYPFSSCVHEHEP